MDILPCRLDELVALVEQQQAIIAEPRATIARLEHRVRDLEGGVVPPRRMPGHKPTPAAANRDCPPRAKRTRTLARHRATPDVRVTHALTVCPDCGTPLAGGAVKRTREVIELASQPVVVGQSRLGVGLLSLIALLREELRSDPARSGQCASSQAQCRWDHRRAGPGGPCRTG